MAPSSSPHQMFSNVVKVSPLAGPSAAAFAPLCFREFELRPDERLLRVRGEAVALGSRAFDLLLALAQRRERLVTKQELLDLVWPGVMVEEHNIATQISTLRKLLGARAVATVPGRGYRLTAPGAEAFVGRGTAAGVDRVAPLTREPTHVPRELTPLLGREDDLRTLAALVKRHRLVTLVGAGGVGKSLLAQHLLKRHGDGRVCRVELAGVHEAEALPRWIAEALGLRAAGASLAALCAAAAGSTVLVALDNAEHLLRDVAATVAALLEAAPGLRFIVTSQAPLRLGAEQVVRLGPLALPHCALTAAAAQGFAAVALFVERVRAADARFVLTDEAAPAAIALCRDLDGLPLAIELAAARAPLLGVAPLAAAMPERLQWLTHNRDAHAPARQQSLRASLEASLAGLNDRERTVFRRLGAVAGSAPLALIQQVAADASGPLDAWAVVDALGALVDRSMVTIEVGDAGASREPLRYRLLESPRLLAIEQLRAAGEDDELRRRCAEALKRQPGEGKQAA
jgi:predicted ATPase/DNA-binding winged helix-turn-helix (wHTH) protein